MTTTFKTFKLPAIKIKAPKKSSYSMPKSINLSKFSKIKIPKVKKVAIIKKAIKKNAGF